MAAGSSCTPRTPRPGPGGAVHANPQLSSRSLDARQMPWAPKPSLGSGRSGAYAAARQEDPPARSPGFTFRRTAGDSAARRPLAVPSTPAAASKSRQCEPRAPRPAPVRQAPPPSPGPAPPRRPSPRADPHEPRSVCPRAAATPAAAAPPAAVQLLRPSLGGRRCCCCCMP